ncbi:MAG: glycosyltransferase family 4 protein [Candidatus Bathyarchaeia archaeon]
MIHANVDMTEWFLRKMGRKYFRNKYNIGIWYWEVSGFPERLRSAFGPYDEIWVTSSFTAGALSRVSPIPVVKVPYPLYLNEGLIEDRPRRLLGLPDDAFIFLFMFDFQSVFERKNPLAVLEAFRRAFGGGGEAMLVINCINSKADPPSHRALMRSASGLNARIIDGHLSDKSYLNLLSACDCYISLHRSEGFGLIMAEAMYLGKPVIATGYSGNMDFMNGDNSLLVRYDLVELERDYGPYEKGNVWAEPDVGHAAELMRWVYENGDEAKGIGRRASEDVRRLMDPLAASREIRERLEHAYRGFCGGAR